MKNKLLEPRETLRDFPEDYNQENGCYQNRCMNYSEPKGIGVSDILI